MIKHVTYECKFCGLKGPKDLIQLDESVCSMVQTLPVSGGDCKSVPEILRFLGYSKEALEIEGLQEFSDEKAILEKYGTLDDGSRIEIDLYDRALLVDAIKEIISTCSNCFYAVELLDGLRVFDMKKVGERCAKLHESYLNVMCYLSTETYPIKWKYMDDENFDRLAKNIVDLKIYDIEKLKKAKEFSRK